MLKLFAAAESPGLQHTLLEGLGQGMRLSSRALSKIWDDPPADLKGAVELARGVFEKAAAIAENESATTAERASALRFLAVGPFKTASEALTKLLSPRSSAELQSAALRALAAFDNPAVAERILAGWDGYGPTLRREAIETLFARKDRLEKLLEAIEANKVFASHIPTARADALRKHTDPWVRRRATKLLAGQIVADRQKVIDEYRDAVTGKGDLARGREVFRKNCTACHKLENTGYEVGASLTAALKNKTRATLLIDILDPSREVDTRYVNYQVTTTAGRSLSGILSVETPTSVTLLRGEKAEDTILRNQIDEIRATNKSLMPDEFEKQIDQKQMADLLEYLMGVVK